GGLNPAQFRPRLAWRGGFRGAGAGGVGLGGNGRCPPAGPRRFLGTGYGRRDGRDEHPVTRQEGVLVRRNCAVLVGSDGSRSLRHVFLPARMARGLVAAPRDRSRVAVTSSF